MTDYLDRLEQQLIEAVPRPTQEPSPRRSTHRRGIPLGLIVAAVLLAVTATALAFTGLLATGPAVRPTRGLSPTAGLGVPARGGSRLLALSAPDPAGGLPWGMRIIHTTRDLVCIQVGRLYHGELGLLGRDGAFADDGRFHPLGPDAIGRDLGIGSPASSRNCQPPGLLSSQEIVGIPQSGLAGESVGKTVGSAERRLISFGLLGPHAQSVTYRVDGHLHTIAVEPVTGAYLIVLPDPRAGARGETGGGTFSEGPISPGSPGPLTAITYRVGGVICRETNGSRIPRQGTVPRAPGACPEPHYRRVSSAPRSLHRPVLVRLQPTPTGGDIAIVTFTAPYRVANALSSYAIAQPAPCHEGTGVTPIDRDVRAGEVIRARLPNIFANACGQTVKLEVIYEEGFTTPAFPHRRQIIGQTTVKRPD